MLANHGAYGNLRFFSEDTFEQMLPRKLDNLLGPDTNVTWGIGLTDSDPSRMATRQRGLEAWQSNSRGSVSRRLRQANARSGSDVL